jgi:hypothetical protein
MTTFQHRMDMHASSLEAWAQTEDAARAGLYRSQAADLRAAIEVLAALKALVVIYDDEFGIVAPEMDAAISAIAAAERLG